MDVNDRAVPRQWETPLPEHFDQLAKGMRSAARVAARELRRKPSDPARRTWALGVLAGHAQAMLGPGMPDHPPVGDAAQEGFVRTALALALHVRAHSWAEKDLGAAGVAGRDDVPHPGESLAADAFDVLNRLMLPDASAEGWTATLVTDLARGDKTLEAAVKLGKYILHPTFLALTDDATRLIGEALHHLHAHRLQELTRSLRHYADAGPTLPAAGPEQTHAAYEPMPLEPKVSRQITTQPERPPRRRRRIKRVPEVHPSAGSTPDPADPPATPQRGPLQSPLPQTAAQESTRMLDLPGEEPQQLSCRTEP
ncbi:hypothetical protein [Streptomyces sp. NPDC052114]|uniref:hypothetical protein n=1 Tax=unclassified Streptomyces TaxID=2593676 RepID=UPI0034222BEF